MYCSRVHGAHGLKVLFNGLRRVPFASSFDDVASQGTLQRFGASRQGQKRYTLSMSQSAVSTQSSTATQGIEQVPPQTKTSCCGPAKAVPVAEPEPAASSCCGPPKAKSQSSNSDVTHHDVSEYYGKTVKTQEDLQTSACLLQGGLSAEEKKLLRNVHEEILSKFYGCGSPIPPLLQGLTMLDLGCGTGRDVYLAAQLVGESGKVIGVDMTDEQLEVARKHQEWHREKFGYSTSNVDFKKGFIEDLKAAGVEDSSVDVVISNCVINLAPDKAPVLGEISRVLREGGELYFSDVFADRRIPEHLRQDKVLFGECLSGALYSEDFRRLMARSGLPCWGVVSAREIDIENRDIRGKVGNIRFFEATVRAVKLPGNEATVDIDAPEDYGQMATYNGGIPGCVNAFVFDKIREFPAGQSVAVDSATAAAIIASRYGKFFEVTEPGAHTGLFTRWGRLPASCAGHSEFAELCTSKPKKGCC